MKFKTSAAGAACAALVAILLFISAPPLKAQVTSVAPGTADQSRQLQQIEPVRSWPSKGNRWALIIGVDKYADPQISPLRGADNDARTLSEALVRYAGFPRDQVILLSTDQPTERQPTRINILRRLSNLASVVPKDGLLLISFAGHGIERGGQAYLIPADSQIADDLNLLEESAVSVNRMKERIRSIGVGQVLILLDACRNDPGGRADAPNPLTNAYVNAFNFDVRNHEVTAFATLYATAVGQRAYEYTEKKQGYFTWAVVEGLKGGAADDKGEVTLANLIKFVRDTVTKRVAIDLGGGKQQRPFSQMDGYKADELVIAISNPMLANSSQPSAPASVDPTAFELSYWDTIKNSNHPDDFKSYLDRYPDGQFAALAKNKINALGVATSESRTSGDNAAELVFWDSIKNGNNANDYRAYLAKYPNGVFADLARSRLAPFEAVEAEKAKEKEISRQTKEFKGQAVMRSSFAGTYASPGRLLIGPRGIEWVTDRGTGLLNSPKPGEPEKEDCRYFTDAKLEGAYIREIHTKDARWDYKWRLQFDTPQSAAEALDAIRNYCSGADRFSTSSSKRDEPNPAKAPSDSAANPQPAATTYPKIRNGSSKAAPEGMLSISNAGLEFTSNGGKNLVIKCSEILKVSTSSLDKLMTVKTTTGEHHFNDLVSIFGSSPSLKPIAENIRQSCKIQGQ